MLAGVLCLSGVLLAFLFPYFPRQGWREIFSEPDALAQSREAMEQFVPAHHILTAADQSQALNLIGRDQVDLLFLDVEMPEINGFTLADYIHKLKPELNYVFLTGHTELEAVSYDYEPIGFLSKPVDPARLQRTLERFRDSRGGAAATLSCGSIWLLGVSGLCENRF